MSGKKKYFTSYLSKDVAELAKYLTERRDNKGGFCSTGNSYFPFWQSSH